MNEMHGLLERLDAGEIVIGDGGFAYALEKRGYVKAGPWTPEVCVEHPEAVRQLHREFLRAGADVMQAFTFNASEDQLSNRGNSAVDLGSANINAAACELAREVANEGDALVSGGVSQTPTYVDGHGKEAVQAEFQKQVDMFLELGVDFLVAEYFQYIEEMEWAIEVLKSSGLPVCATMCIGPEGDLHGVPTAACGVRMAKAGADVVGVNCQFDPDISLASINEIKRGLEAEGIKKHLMAQPIAFKTPDANKYGFVHLKEGPFALEPRICTRWDIHKFAREAYTMGVRYIGGCCGFEPYHTRAIAEELCEERGKLPAGSEKHAMWGGALQMHTKPWVRQRASKTYWQNIKPASGRPFCPSLSKPDGPDDSNDSRQSKENVGH